MSLTTCTTVALVKELLRRAEHTDALLALVNGAGGLVMKAADVPVAKRAYVRRIPSAVPEKKKRRRMAHLRDAVATVKMFGGPVSAREIHYRMPNGTTFPATVTHLNRGAVKGVLVRSGHPGAFLYSLPKGAA